MKRLLCLSVLMLVLLLSACGTQEVVINEIMASNGEIIADEDGDYNDWIELYNPGTEPVDLEGYYLSDDDDNPLRWRFPAVVLAPGEYLLVWASGKDRTEGELHTNFRISIDGEPITLTRPDGRSAVDRVEATHIPRDMSFGRLPDGGDEWFYFLIPSPGGDNELSRDHTLEAGHFDEPQPTEISLAWLAFGALLLLFVPLFVVFYRKTRR